MGISAIVASLAFAGVALSASGDAEVKSKPSKFASLKASEVNVRVGPSFSHEIVWTFRRQGLPVKVIQEYDIWRRIQDSDGDEGWVHKQLLSNRRTALIAPWEKGLPLATRREPEDDAAITALVEPGVVADVTACTGAWCHLEGEGFTGWIEQRQLWGVAPSETFE